MGFQRFVFLAAAFTIAASAGVGATGDEFVSKDSLSKEPFGDVKPFDLSKRQTATNNAEAKKSETTKDSPQPDSGHALERNPKVADEILNVNELGDPERIVFEGVKLFPEKQLRLALACDLKYQAAARPSSEIRDFVTTLEKRLTAGYQSSGCPDVTVFASRDSKRKVIVAKIIEGPRYRKGEIHVTGSKMIDEQAMREILTKPQRARAWEYIEGNKPLKLSAKETSEQSSADDDSDPVVFWKAGEAVDFYKTDRSYLDRAIQFALAELGFIGVSFRAELERDKDRGVANLQISILHDKPQAVVGDVEVSGLKRDSREALLNYLKVAPNDPLNSQTLQRIDERLSASCRYWTRKIEVLSVDVAPGASYPESVKPKLKLTLEEYAPAPPLGQPLSDVDEALKKCSDWVNSLAGDFGDRDLVCTAASADLGGFAQHTQVAMAADGTMAIDAQFISNYLRINHSAILDGHSVEIYDWSRGDKFCISSEYSPTLQIRTSTFHTSDGKQDAGFKLLYTGKRVDNAAGPHALRNDIHVEPVVLLHYSHRPSAKTKLKDNIVTIADDQFELRIDEKTGQIRSVKSASFLSAGIFAIDFRLESNFVSRAVEKARGSGTQFDNRCDPKQPILSGVSYALEQVACQPMATRSRLSRRLLQTGAILPTDDEFKRFFADAYADFAMETSDNDHFSIPGHLEISTDNFSESLEYYAPYLADKLFPRGSFPWTYLREYGFLFQRVDGSVGDSPKMWQREDARLDSAHECGPVGCLIRAWLWQQMYPDSTELPIKNANDGLRDLSDEAFLKDLRYLTDGDRGFASICRAIDRNCTQIVKDDDKDAQAPSGSKAYSVISKLGARREAKPDEPLADTIRLVMLESWHDGWKDVVEAQLHSMSSKAVSESKVSAAEK